MQKLTEKLPKIVSAFSNNAITSKVFGIFLWNKKQWKADKVALKLMCTFIYFMYLFSLNFALIFQTSLTFGHFGRFLVFPSFFFCQMWLDWTVLWFFQRIRANIYTSIYFAEKFFPKFAWRFQILQKFGHFFIIIFRNFL